VTDLSLFDVIHSQRATRRLYDQPVPDEFMQTVLEAAVRAPSGGNRQPWSFLVVRERTAKHHQLGVWYLQAWQHIVANINDTEANSESYRSGERMGRQMEHVPVVFLACIALAPQRMSWVSGSSIYPAIQNLM